MSNIERYIIKPSLQLYGVYEVTGNQKEEINNEFEKDEKGNSLKIIQKIDGLKLMTKTILKVKLPNDRKYQEKKEIEEELEKGQKLVYIKNRGFVIPEMTICKIDEALSDIEVLKEVL